MDIFKLTQSLEALIYDFMMWVIFYPYTLFSVIAMPRRMLAYTEGELSKGLEAARFDRALNPPFFLFLSIIIGWILAPDVSSVFKQMGDGVLGKAVGNSSWNLLLVRMITFCAFPLVGALIYEWQTPLGISRESFRKPFYQQAYLTGPFALTFSLGFVILGYEKDEVRIASTLMFMLICLAWFVWAQSLFFQRAMGSRSFPALVWAVVSVAMGAAVYSLTFLLM